MPRTRWAPRSVLLREALRGHRIDLALSQEELAQHLGQPQSYVSKVEAGDRRLDVEEFLDYAEALGIDARDLIMIVMKAGQPKRAGRRRT